jgi:hypothetical protein
VSERHVTGGRGDRGGLGPITAAFTKEDPFSVTGLLFIYDVLNDIFNRLNYFI